MVDKFQPGFYGSTGVGAGKHAANSNDNLDAEWANRLERAIMNLKSVFEGDGLYGPFRMESISGTITEYFNGDTVTSSFTIKQGVHQFQAYNYDIYLDDSYANSVEPTNLGGKLVNFDINTKLSTTLQFDTPPPSGVKNVKIKYHVYTQLASQLDSGAFLNDWLEGE